jgi:hypothetical protein
VTIAIQFLQLNMMKKMVPDAPHYCPFCAEMIVDVDELDEDDDE